MSAFPRSRRTRSPSLSRRVTTTTLMAVGAGLVMVSAITVERTRSLADTAEQEARTGSDARLVDTSRDFSSMVKALGQATDTQLKASLSVAQRTSSSLGSFSTRPTRTVTWQAVNQVDKSTLAVKLPTMYIGNTWLGQNKATSTPSPLVDDVAGQVGGVATVFQRMNKAGDMLRVSTNVVSDGKRAIGTYIPATSPDGTQNKVLKTVLGGQTYYGPAQVVGNWYATAYAPLRDRAGTVNGMLFVGVRQQNVESLRSAVTSMRISEQGTAYVIGATGDRAGIYDIAPEGAKDGDSVLDAQDETGKEWVKHLVAAAVELDSGQTARFDIDLPGGNRDLPTAVQIAYYEPWDWVLVTQDPLGDLASAQERVESALTRTELFLAASAVIALALGTALGIFGTRRATRPVTDSSAKVREMAEGDHGLSNLSQRLSGVAQDTSLRAANVSRASSSVLEEVGSAAAAATELSLSSNQMADNTVPMTHAVEQLTENMQQISLSATEATTVATEADNAAKRTAELVQRVAAAGNEVADVVKIITSIAAQTRLLALNATIESARAGEAGRGFAVVAADVKALADETGRSSETIQAKVDAMQSQMKEATEAIGRIVETVDTIAHLQHVISRAVDEQNAGTGDLNAGQQLLTQGIVEQQEATGHLAEAVERISAAVHEIASDVVEVAGSAEDTTQVSAAVKKAAEDLGELSGQLDQLVSGGKS
ncbi:MAG: methyl-accepting chemotaxis protein [Actinomycetota bacterium]|nr:methyl-accepting chemotaxis protein [Actinomycetota bacterium]